MTRNKVSRLFLLKVLAADSWLNSLYSEKREKNRKGNRKYLDKLNISFVKLNVFFDIPLRPLTFFLLGLKETDYSHFFSLRRARALSFYFVCQRCD